MKTSLFRSTALLFVCALISVAGLDTAIAQGQNVPGLPKPDHVLIVLMENHSFNGIIGAAASPTTLAAPYINALASDANSALFTQSYAIQHPSQPNYLDMYSGSNHGVTDDNVPAAAPYTSDNLGIELLNAKLSFTTYSEDLPSVGFNGATSNYYARKHNPAANWMGTGTNQIPATTNQPMTAFPTDFTQLPTVCYVVPNLVNDMHNGTDPSTILQGDAWVKTNLDSYVQWAKTHNSLLILTFDEDNDSSGNHITTIFAGQMVKAGQYSEPITQMNILRTIEDMYSLPYADSAAYVSPITGVWNASAGVSPDGNSANTQAISAFPNPLTHSVTIQGWMQNSGTAEISIVNATGVEVAQLFSGELEAGQYSFVWNNAAGSPDGTYECLVRMNGQVQSAPIVLLR